MTAHSLESSTRRRVFSRSGVSLPVLPIVLGTLVQVAVQVAAQVATYVWLVVIALPVRVAKRIVRGVQNRRAAAALAHLDAHMLADIGLTRSDVRDAAAAPMWDDPTTLLRTRALERRLRRHRLDLGFRDQSKR